jgi:photosystem II stability/assembly factor-like uncharacterized protein
VRFPKYVRFGLPRLTFLVGLLGWFFMAWSVSGSDALRGIADGSFHACAMLDIDRAIAVGDRGLILRSEDGGKSWSTLGNRSSHSYFAIGFDSADTLAGATRSGLIVGGRIDSVTGRSEGVVETTNDDGKTWTRVSLVGLPRLLGLQRMGHRHWIAWGDWSDHWQSSLFETMDGGRTWSSRPTPSGHLQAAAIDPVGRILLIDRTGAVFFSVDGIEFQRSSLVTDPFRPLRFCKVSSEGWWVGGDHGQLYFSNDGSHWTRIFLPGIPSDHALIQLRDAAISGGQIWVVGTPGSVVWHSMDHGRKWSVSSTQFHNSLNAIHAFDSNVLLACGEMGRIQVSRNSGSAWIDCHRSGVRVACQAIASSERTVPWDLLAHVTHESHRRASAIVVHHQDLHGGKGHRPEAQERVAEAGRQMGLDRTLMLSDFPVGDLRSGIRSTDLGYYQIRDHHQSELIRRLVLEIRCAQPDLIVAEDTNAKQSLTSATAIATLQAIRLAASPAFRCFSSESGITIPEWNSQRVLMRGSESGGLIMQPTMLLSTSNVLLSEVMQPVRFLDRNGGYDSQTNSARSTYRMSSQRTVSIKHPLDGLILDQETRLIEHRTVRRKASNLVAASNAPSRFSQLLSTRGAGIWVESAWDDNLIALSKDLSNDVLMQCLWSAAIDSRRSGNWHRWNTALNAIIDRDGKGPMSELAYQELMTYFGSAEVHRIIQDQWSAIDAAKKDSSQSSSAVSNTRSSPFASGRAVSLVAFDSASRATPIARLRGLETFTRLLSRWPEEWQSRRTEPEWAWLIASRYRARSLLRGVSREEGKETIFWPPQHPSKSGWTEILAQEQRLITDQPLLPPSISIPWITTRPFLDGNADDLCWKQAKVVALTDAWSEDAATSGEPTAEVRIARDADFLFIHSHSRKSSQGLNTATKDRPAKQSNQQRRRDALDSDKDHIRFRLDVDRDYATWFELAWDIDGETLDQCNDMPWWNPEWFIAVADDRDTWSAEIAIPVASLMPTPADEFTAMPRTAPDSVVTASKTDDRSVDIDSIRWGDQTWGMSFVREIPSSNVQSAPICESDRWTRDRWFLAFPQQVRSSQPEQTSQLSESPTGFSPPRR